MIAWHWLIHAIGADYGGPYGRFIPGSFWSGFGSDLGEAALVGALWHRFNCHEAGCWRIGRHTVDGTPWCNQHHQSARERLNF